MLVGLSTYEIWANPKQVADTDYPQISKLLDMPLVEVKRRLGNDKTFVLLKRQVDADTAGKLDKLAIDGVTQIADSKRFYPEGESAAHVVGFTNVEDKGQEGVEARRCATGRHVRAARVIRDRLGRIVSDTRRSSRHNTARRSN